MKNWLTRLLILFALWVVPSDGKIRHSCNRKWDKPHPVCARNTYNGRPRPNCKHGHVSRFYTVWIQISHYDIVCCDQVRGRKNRNTRDCPHCNVLMFKSFCEGKYARSSCDYKFTLSDKTRSRKARVVWRAPVNRNWGSKVFQKGTKRDRSKGTKRGRSKGFLYQVETAKEASELNFLVHDVDKRTRDDLLVNATMLLPPVYKCKGGKKFANAEWFKKHKGRVQCNLFTYRIPKKTRRALMGRRVFNYWSKFPKCGMEYMYMQMMWKMKIISHFDVAV